MAATQLLTVIEPDGGVNGHDVGMTNDELLHCYRTMLRTRVFDDTCMKLQRSGRIGFSIPNKGVEATQIGAASAVQKTDWLFPSYRDFGMALYHGVPMAEMMHNMFGNALDSAKGRQMPVHFSFEKPIRFVSISSPIGTHLPQAVGAAYAMKLRGEKTVALTSFGDGGTSSLGFHSGMNFAAVWKAPVVFLCQNNQWAISCPSSGQTASESYAIKAKAYGMPGVLVDGNDLLAVRKAVLEAVERARKGGGPSLIEAFTFRMAGHSTSDDPTRYVPKEQFAEWEKKDPVLRFEKFLAKKKLWNEDVRAQYTDEATAEIQAAVQLAEHTPRP
ncbi:MAG: thiamine pyrophosphate-dependent dehydrogenase E1 component subunit alpha, partial [Planctomycetes bacterium]|nr:thiamine pyrophosphate-dependent dehydrogenase E1 component subunit alpha [Planctomycetota bacterium]